MAAGQVTKLIRADIIISYRKYKVHTIVFFIFLVANIGGSLTPLGDPPLFLGFLKGVSFFWTTSISSTGSGTSCFGINLAISGTTAATSAIMVNDINVEVMISSGTLREKAKWCQTGYVYIHQQQNRICESGSTIEKPLPVAAITFPGFAVAVPNTLPWF